MSRIIVKNLPKDMKEESLKEMVSSIGTVTDISLKYTKNGAFRQFAFVGFLGDDEGARAVKLLDKSFLQTSKLTVEVASNLGDANKPRAWSKYAKGSSANDKIYEKNTEKDKTNEKKKTSSRPLVDTVLDDLADNPEFEEFLKVHEKKSLASTWTNDDVTLKKNKEVTLADSTDIVDKETGEVEGEKEPKKTKKKKRKKQESDVGKKTEVKPDDCVKSDMDYLKSKKTESNVFSDDSDSEDEKIKSNKNDKESEVCKQDGEGNKEKRFQEEEEEEKEEEEKDDDKVEEIQAPAPLDIFRIKMRGLEFNMKEKHIREFFHPLKIKSIKFARWKPSKKNHLGIAYADFENKKDLQSAMLRNKDKIGKRYLELFMQIKKKENREKEKKAVQRDPAPWEIKAAAMKNEGDETLTDSGRIFARNLSYLCKEEDLQTLFSGYGPLVETHFPLDRVTKKPKGFAFITYMMPEHAVKAFNELDGSVFQGRMLHLLPSQAKKEAGEALGDDAPYKKKREAELKKQSGSAHTWNSLFLGANAVADVVAEKYGTTKQAVLNPDSRNSLAVRMALGETQIVNETRDFLIENGVSLDAFGDTTVGRSKNCVLAKNLPAGTTAEEMSQLFAPFGTVSRLVLPPSGITAIIEFQEATEAKTAFRRLAFTKFKHMPLYLEWAPTNIFKSETGKRDGDEKKADDSQEVENSKSAPNQVDATEAESNSTLYVKNINFTTTEQELNDFFSSSGQVVSAVIARHKDTKTGDVLSRGYGFVQFLRANDSKSALKTLQRKELQGHALELKLSNRNTAENSRKGDRKLGSDKKTKVSSKILVRNIPFETHQKEIEELFKGFGELKSVRLPKKAVGKGKHRGFAFIEFMSKEDAKRAFDTFCHSTHLLGRRLVLEWAEEEESVEGMRKRTADRFGDGKEVVGKRMKKATISSDEFQSTKKDDEIE